MSEMPTGFPTGDDRDRVRAYLAEQAPVWEEQFPSGPGMVVALDDAAVAVARLLASERRKAFNHGAVAGMKLQAEVGK